MPLGLFLQIPTCCFQRISFIPTEWDLRSAKQNRNFVCFFIASLITFFFFIPISNMRDGAQKGNASSESCCRGARFGTSVGCSTATATPLWSPAHKPAHCAQHSSSLLVWVSLSCPPRHGLDRAYIGSLILTYRKCFSLVILSLWDSLFLSGGGIQSLLVCFCSLEELFAWSKDIFKEIKAKLTLSGRRAIILKTQHVLE